MVRLRSPKFVMPVMVLAFLACLSVLSQSAWGRFFGLTLSSINTSVSHLKGGDSTTGTVTMSNVVTKDTAVPISSNRSSVQVPATVTVLKGSKVATFKISTSAVASNETATITGSYGGVEKTATITVESPGLTSITCSPLTVPGGGSSTATLIISSPAPSGGLTVTLASDKPTVTVPDSVVVAGGATQATFLVKTTAVALDTTATITGTSSSRTASGTLTVTGPYPTSITLTPDMIVGGQKSIGRVTLNTTAPSGGVPVSLSAGSSLTIPATVTVPEGKKSASFNIASTGVQSDRTFDVAAKVNGVQVTSPLKVRAPQISSLTLTYDATAAKVTGKILLSSDAPASGIVVSLASTDPCFISVPSSVMVKTSKGITQGVFVVPCYAVLFDTGAHITARLNDLPTSQNVTILATTKVPQIRSMLLKSKTITGGFDCHIDLTLSYPATVGGSDIALKSNSSVISVPIVVTIPTGQTKGSYDFMTTDVPASITVQIDGALNGKSDLCLETVNPYLLQAVQVGPRIYQGGDAIIRITGPTAPPRGQVVTLAKNDASLLALPASVMIPGGQTSTAFYVKVPGTAAGAPYYSSVTASTKGSNQTAIAVAYSGWTQAGGNTRGNGQSVSDMSAFNGVLSWAIQPRAGSTLADPVVRDDGTSYVTDTVENLYEIQPDGTIGIAIPIGHASGPPAIGADGNVYVASNVVDGDKIVTRLFAFNPITRNLAWTYTFDSVSDGIATTGPSVGPDGSIYQVTGFAGLVCINRDGTLKWKNGSPKMAPMFGVDGTVYSGNGSHFYALNPESGAIVLDSNDDLSFVNSFAVGEDGTVYLERVPSLTADSHGWTRLLAFNGENRSLKWTYTLTTRLEAPFSVGGSNVCMSSGKNLILVDTSTGVTNIIFVSQGGKYVGRPVLAGGKVFVADVLGNVGYVDPVTFLVRSWKLRSAPTFGQMAIAGGSIWIRDGVKLLRIK